MSAIEFSIVMPCLNEARTVVRCIEKALGFFERQGITAEVIVADNGSSDGSRQLAQQAGARVVAIAEKGYGNALRGGFAQAKGQYIIMGDADDSYDFSRLEAFVEKLREGSDLVMGNRFRGGILPGAMPALHRYLGNPVLSFLGRLFFRNHIGDFHCGLRGFSKEACQKMQLTGEGMELASEIVFKASLLRMSVAEVPVVLHRDGRDRKPHLRSWHDGWRHLKLLLLYCPRWLFLYPGLLLLAGSLLLAIRLVVGQWQIAQIRLDIHTLFYAGILSVAGLTLSLFYLFARVNSHLSGIQPLSDRLKRLVTYWTIERGLYAGIPLILAGVAGALYSLIFWSQSQFGNLDPVQLFRIILPTGFLMIHGLLLLFSAFLLHALITLSSERSTAQPSKTTP